MSEKQENIVEKLADTLPLMTERERGYLEGSIAMAAVMSGQKEEKEAGGKEEEPTSEE